MSIVHPPNVADIARTFAEAMEHESAARDLYFRQWGLTSELWLVTDAVDRETERQLRRSGRLLRHRFPEALIDLHVINRALIEDKDFDALIPEGAAHQRIH